MSNYLCAKCSYRTSRWMGFCPQCRATGTLSEVPAAGASSATPEPIGSGTGKRMRRLDTGMTEFDRVLGGGAVPGSVVLLGGPPGVGKSTVVLQIGAALARRNRSALIASGEESLSQIGLRAHRVNAVVDGLDVVAESDAGNLAELIRGGSYPLVVIDSIQTVRDGASGGGSGAMSQIRDAAARLIAAAKESDVVLILIGHVTKDGAIAGPKVLEHMVDVVLALDGDPHRNLRFLRGAKNRFGSIDEVGVFEMTDRGLETMRDPSLALTGSREDGVSGSVLFPSLDGRRSLLVEIQALVVPTRSAQPRRSVKGLAVPRVHQIVAAIERHGGLRMSTREVYVSVMGGISIAEPAADLPVAMAIASAATGTPLGSVAAWGEVGLTGEVRAVGRADRRRAEAERLGVERIIEAGDGRRLGDLLRDLGIQRRVPDRRARLHAVPAGEPSRSSSATPGRRMD